jgi:hypothetical protein
MVRGAPINGGYAKVPPRNQTRQGERRNGMELASYALEPPRHDDEFNLDRGGP